VLTKYHLVDRSEKIEDGACSMYGGVVCTGVGWGHLRERDYLEDTGLDGRIILRRIFRKWGGMDWINPYPANMENRLSS
jgi:hypothetical protein